RYGSEGQWDEPAGGMAWAEEDDDALAVGGGVGGLGPTLAAVEGHGPRRLDGGEQPGAACGGVRGDRRQQPSGEPAAVRAGPDGEFVHLEGVAQPVVRPPSTETRGGLRI